MAYVQKDGQGALFKNLKKEKDTQPDYQGSCTINGKEWQIGAWIKESGDRKFMSLSFKPPYKPDK